jgi:hypothetical protein
MARSPTTVRSKSYAVKGYDRGRHHTSVSALGTAGQYLANDQPIIRGFYVLDPLLRTRLTQAADVICDAVKEAASAFSRRIPAGTFVRSYSNAVYIITYGSIAPNAYPFEDAVYHPYFAKVGSERYRHGPWFQQPYRPYMEEGAEAGITRAADIFANIINDWAAATGWTPT